MFHDAPVEAAVVVHRHRRRLATGALGDASAQDGAAQRIIDAYQLHRVANFVLSGVTADGAGLMAAPLAAATVEACGEVNMSSSQCCCRTAAAPSPPRHPYMRVALQFPDELLGDAVAVVQCLNDLIVSDARYVEAMHAKKELEISRADAEGTGTTSGTPTRSQQGAPAGAAQTAAQVRPATMDNPNCPTNVIRLFVLADNTFGSCCPDEITAQHYLADCIVHFGDACMSRSTRLPIFYVQPVFHFSALVPSTGPPEGLLDVEATVVLEVVRRVACAIRHRLTCWWADRMGSTSDAAGTPCPVRPRLTVVGTYPTKAIVNASEQRWGVSDASGVRIDWPVFEAHGVPATGESAILGDAQDNNGAPLSDASTEEDFWLVNGVRFPRLPSSSSRAPFHEVQYLLFIGAAGSAALVHVLTAEQYNRFHYSDLSREYLEWDGGAEESRVPQVCVLDNTFGDGTEATEELRSACKRVSGAGGFSCMSLELTDAVQRWIRATCADSVAAALVTRDCMRAQQALQRRMRQRAFNIESVRASSAIGILVASLAIEGYLEVTQQLHQLIRAYQKRSYVIYIGHLNEFKLANFVDTVDCFVAVACPYSRPSHFPEKEDGFMKPIVSPAELLVALTSADDAETDKLYGMAAAFTTSFEAVLRELKTAVRARRGEIESRLGCTDTENSRKRNEEEERWASSGALVHVGTEGGGRALTVQAGSQGALARLYERQYVGLDPRVGQTAIQAEVLEGKHGIARGYAGEREEQSVPSSDIQ
ncbi:hypothetical protein JKF63_02271 [Porcisia hertigi]|uniref:2-(3-amino-3-carboxypropyl)histidine synthase subunit 2 n=1 Tax=Porcisia hertigi TaxID=2761500 RepID=A0A836L1J1_9TRYP|nr:hypothetical protein JKF63_02271 [Porcisia hertigi]